MTYAQNAVTRNIIALVTIFGILWPADITPPVARKQPAQGNGTNVPLYQEKMSVPALNIQLESGQVCYGALATGLDKLNIEYNNQIYHAIE